MRGARQRVRRLLAGGQPDRVPLYDLIRNDAVLSHFAGQEITPDNGPELVPGVLPSIVDATRPAVRSPHVELEELLPDGRRVSHYRWTSWTEDLPFLDAASHAAVLRQRMADAPVGRWGPDEAAWLQSYLNSHRELQTRFGEDLYLFWSSPANTGLMGLMTEIGVESFSYLWADQPDIIPECLEWNTLRGLDRIRHLPADHGIEGVMIGEDIAYKTATILPARWLLAEFIPRLARLIEALHGRGIKVIFHSDGNLMEILGALVDAGVDVLNPVETQAGMDPGDIHRRHPDLILAGAIDVSQLLPLGTPAEVRSVVTRTIAETEGRIMVGSSTELQSAVPLANFMAMRDAVLEYVG